MSANKPIRVKVVHEDGRVETIALVSPVSVVRGVALNRLVSGDGMEHFFTSAGYYDGWGRAASPMQSADAARLTETIEACREIDD